MRKLVLAILILFLVFAANAQAQQNPRVFTLKWLEPKGYPVFDRASYLDGPQTWPMFSEKIPVPLGQQGYLPEVQLAEAQYEPVPDEETHYYQQLSSAEHAIAAWIQTSRMQDFVRFEFNPVRRNPQSGQLERLLTFRPDIRYTPKQDSLTHRTKSASFVSQSVLASGKWHKIAISQSGIYKITYDKLVELGFDHPENIRLYGNGGKQLPFDSSLDRTDDLIENPIYIHAGTDGTFNSGDYLLFYGKGIVHWQYDSSLEMFVHRLHQYSEQVYYYLTDSGAGAARIGTQTAAQNTATQQVNTYDYYAFREKDSVNLIQSGRLWAWKHFKLNMNYDFRIPVPNRIEEAPVEILSSLLMRSSKTSANSSIVVTINDDPVQTISLPGVNTSNYEALYATTALEKNQIQTTGEELLVSYRFSPSNPAAMGWIDYFDINARSRLTYTGSPLFFRDIESTGEGQVAEFRISGGLSGLQLWNISQTGATHAHDYSLVGNSLRFLAPADELQEYVLFDPKDANIPEPQYDGAFLGAVDNQNLHAAAVPEMVIIVQNELREQAEELAQIHQDHDGLTCLIVEPMEIYNEFSSGIQDPTAIRDFMSMLYSKSASTGLALKYLLFFGDGTYHNKLIVTDPEYKNYLPTYQSLESLYPTRSYVTDDFFGLLDNGEGLQNGLLDIGIGRFPVSSPYEASVVVEKVRIYLSPESLGDWRNLICFIGDDEDGNAHMRDANTLADIIDTKYPSFNVDKIFLDAFQQVVTASGETYPEVNLAINDRIRKGALIMNYLGHGSEKGLAHENIVTSSTIKSWKNLDKLTLFMTATCEFSRFDNHEFLSAGEDVLLNPNGGGIGLFTTTRLVYSSPNFRLNREFYNYVFDRPNEEKYRFGDLLRLSKNAVGSELNKLNFTLLADPAIALNYPDKKIIMTHINEQPVAEFSDTLKAMSRVSVQGYVADLSNTKLEDFQGLVYPTIYDKQVTLTTLNNDGGVPMEFNVQENILFRGKSSIRNGDFEFQFIVPKDIGYNVGPGRFSFYGTDGETDGSGVNRSIRIGGSDALIQDEAGPEIRLFMNDTTFVYGGITNENPVLLARLNDENGINTTGNGIGHDITAIIDDNKQNIIVLNDYYESNLDDYRGGTVRYPLTNLEPGMHEVKLKVWDILNNSTETALQFEVYSTEKVVLENLLNYPNPFTTQTAFYFDHNQSGAAFDAQIQIYTVSGRLVKSFDFLLANETQIQAGKFRVGPVYWDGLDQYGDPIGRGTYFYRVKIRTPNGTQEAFQKLVKL